MPLVNNDKIGIHLVPIVWERTWENKGIKQIQVLDLGVKDKKQVTMVVSSATNGYLLLGQVVGQSKIKYTKKVDVFTLTMCLSYNYHKVA